MNYTDDYFENPFNNLPPKGINIYRLLVHVFNNDGKILEGSTQRMEVWAKCRENAVRRAIALTKGDNKNITIKVSDEG